MRLSVVILSFNTRDLTSQCLESLIKVQDMAIGREFEVVVVDNGSRDGSPGMIREKFPMVKLVEAGENLGFAKGNNVGVENTDPEADYILFLNSDTIVPSGTLNEMVDFMDANPEVGVSTCKIVLWNGEFDDDCHRGFPTPWASLTRLLGLAKIFPRSRFFNRYYQGWRDLETTHDIDSAVGAFMLVPRKVGDRINWWDEDFFLNGEDIDFCYRVNESGYRVTYHPQVQITHYRGASKGTRKESKEVTQASREGKKVVANATVDAMQLFYNKHYRDKYPRILSWLIDSGVWLLRKKRVSTRH